MDKHTADKNPTSTATTTKPSYVRPMIKVMEEKDLLTEFQVSVNANSWWGMM